MPGAAAEHKHHHFCTEVLLGLGYTEIGLCQICGRYLFISTDKDKTTYRVATQREGGLVAELMYMKAQITRMSQ